MSDRQVDVAERVGVGQRHRVGARQGGQRAVQVSCIELVEALPDQEGAELAGRVQSGAYPDGLRIRGRCVGEPAHSVQDPIQSVQGTHVVDRRRVAPVDVEGPVDQVTRRGRVVHPAENCRGPLVERGGVQAFGVVDRVQALADQLVGFLEVVLDQRVDRGGVDLAAG